MDSNDFWCRAFLAAANNGRDLDGCERAADAYLTVAQRRGMVTGERAARAVTQADIAQAVGDYLSRSAQTGPTLERVEFKAWPVEGNQWTVRAPGIGALLVQSGCERFSVNGASIRIKWGESPPQPIEVWIERPAKGGA